MGARVQIGSQMMNLCRECTYAEAARNVESELAQTQRANRYQTQILVRVRLVDDLGVEIRKGIAVHRNDTVRDLLMSLDDSVERLGNARAPRLFVKQKSGQMV